MKFRYSFQKIVDLKNNERNQAEWVLSKAIGTLKNEETRLSVLFDSRNEVYAQLASASEEKTTISQMMLMQSYVDHIDQQIAKKRGDIQVAQSIVINKQEKLSEKIQDEKVWNKARETAFTRYKSFNEKKEQDALDEMATNRFKKSSQPQF